MNLFSIALAFKMWGVFSQNSYNADKALTFLYLQSFCKKRKNNSHQRASGGMKWRFAVSRSLYVRVWQHCSLWKAIAYANSYLMSIIERCNMVTFCVCSLLVNTSSDLHAEEARASTHRGIQSTLSTLGLLHNTQYCKTFKLNFCFKQIVSFCACIGSCYFSCPKNLYKECIEWQMLIKLMNKWKTCNGHFPPKIK